MRHLTAVVASVHEKQKPEAHAAVSLTGDGP